MSTITIIDLVNIGQFNYTERDGTVTTFYGWAATVNIDGQVGVDTVWIDSNDPVTAEGCIIQDLEDNPADFGGIVDNDPSQSDPGKGYPDQGDPAYAGGDGDYGDEDLGFEDDDGGGDDVAGGDYGDEVGVSV